MEYYLIVRKNEHEMLHMRELGVKIIIRFDLTLHRLAPIPKNKNNQCWCRGGEERTLVPCLWECHLVQTFWKAT